MNFDIHLKNAIHVNNDNSDKIVSLLLKKNHVKNVKQFLHPSLDMIKRDITLPQDKQIHDMKRGTDLIRQAINHDDKIVIYSDYDTDGITSNAIMYSLLKKLGAVHVLPYCPSRKRDGYGLNMHESRKMVQQHVNLVITTDNGIASVKEVNYLRHNGVKVIITDHHDWQNRVPKANAIIMPNCPYDKFHFDGFCGAGIAFMIACYMLGRVATEYLDLACLGTVADSVPLRQEDRVIVYYGMKQIRQGKRVGIYDLVLAHIYHKLQASRFKDKSFAHAKQMTEHKLHYLTAVDLSFGIIPRLNTLGRMEKVERVNGKLVRFDANMGRKLLLATK